MTFKILSCDGGGIRGLITIMLIEDLQNKTSFLDRTDGFAGTSTGGLLAIGLAGGTDVSKLLDIYNNDGGKIFTKNPLWTEGRFGEDPESLEAGKTSCQYDNSGLRDVIMELVGERKLSDIDKFLLVNSAQLWGEDDGSLKGSQSKHCSWLPKIFSSANEFRNIKLRDAALATSAAPTYFPPYNIGSYGYFADGGVFANNPSLVAVSEAFHSGKVSEIAELRVLSLGTGNTNQGIRPDNFRRYRPLKWGANCWLWPWSFGDNVPELALFNLTMDTTAELAAIQAKQILGSNYRRANVVLAEPYPLDDYKNLDDLRTATRRYLESPEWEETVNWVKYNWK